MEPKAGASGGFDWLRCPRCSYDLRGLIESRCPECGTPFSLARLQAEHTRMAPRPSRDPIVRFFFFLIALVFGCFFLSCAAREMFGALRPAGLPLQFHIDAHDPIAVYAGLVIYLPIFLLFVGALVLLIRLRKYLNRIDDARSGDKVLVVVVFTLPILVFAYVCAGGIAYFD
jgi:hypothetical protein